MIKLLFVVAVCAMFAPLMAHVAVQGATMRDKWRKVREHWLAALLAFGALVGFALASDKPQPPTPPVQPPQEIEDGVIYLHTDPPKKRAWIMRGEIINLKNGEAFP